MKIIFDHNKANPNKPNIYVKLKGKKPQFLFEKEEGHAVRRKSTYSFFYKENLYNLKNNTIKEVHSNAWKRV